MSKANGQGRTLYRYTVPKGLANETGTAKLGFVILTPNEEKMAARRIGPTEIASLAQELAKACLREVNGKKVSMGDGTADEAWDTLHPKVRTLCATVYSELHTPAKEDAESFLESVEVEAQ